MVGKVYNLQPNAFRVNVKGLFNTYFDSRRQKWVTRSAPRKLRPPNEKALQTRAQFTAIVKLIKNAASEERTAADEITAHSGFLARDAQMAAAVGNLVTATDANGKLYLGWRMANAEIQALLDAITNAEGALLVRTSDAWQGLAPGTDGQVLVFDETSGIPDWADIPTDAQEVLDQISDTHGVILFRGASGWVALAPGSVGKFLATQGAGNDPTWATPPSSPTPNLFTYNFVPTTTFGHNFSATGNVIHCTQAMTIYELACQLTTVTGGTYKLGIAPFNTSTRQFTSAPTYGPTVTVGTGAAHDWVTAQLGGFVTSPGTDYLVFIVRTNGTTTTTMTMEINGAAYITAPGFSQLNASGSQHIANQAPSTTDAWTAESGFYAFSWNYTL